MGLQTRKLPGVFLREFQLGSRGLGVGILLKLLRSIAPLGRIQRSLSSYSLLLWKTKMRKDTNLQKKVYCNMNYLSRRTGYRYRTICYQHSQIENSIVPSPSCPTGPANVRNP